MNVGMVSGFSSITNGSSSLNEAKMNQDSSKFKDLLNQIQNKKSEVKNAVPSAKIIQDGKINGDIKSDFHGFYTSPSDKISLPRGAASNQAQVHGENRTIDRTSKLYEKSMELECFFVKQVLQSMRNTVTKTSLGTNDFAGKMYEDMLYDEYAVSFTKNAGLGLADQIYLELNK